ncbi:N-acetylglucosamine-6-phosphate deacetylase [Dermabacter vaginalis]|uniref:N-acetylglucosamine-6-phosphate deacetylase n=1 Tax=Dermabacter vaginalis TaxID=1630135 RepID=A0A1B0ZIX8_9MICO|nr:amidohydrolase family protein [Dermabacter vaginalis]ANP27891.1 N-acetylglucosamine-6-phosphate deacetylase [Dermabacter vaginalis]
MVTRIDGTAFLSGSFVPDAAILLEGDTITYAGPARGVPSGLTFDDHVRHDGLILPGLVDLHCHGGGGFSFPDTEDPAQAAPAIAEHRAHGTTSIVASLVTAAQDTLMSRVRALRSLVEAGELAGIHLEGPFISRARKGAHDPQFIAEGNAARTLELLEEGGGAIATMTIAPEADLDGSVSRALIAHGALPSYGHTDCIGEQMVTAIQRAQEELASVGPVARSLKPTATHLFNAMRPIHHRDAGPAFAAIDQAAAGTVVAELIADGVHTSADTVRYTFDLIGDGHIMLITDAMAATGMADGDYVLGSLPVTVKDGVVTLTEGGAIAGGTAHLLDVVRFAHLEAGVPLERAILAATATPATVLGRDDIGEIREGARSDLVLVESTGLSPERVMHGGTWVR